MPVDQESEAAMRARQADVTAKAALEQGRPVLGMGDDSNRENKFDKDLFTVENPAQPSAGAGDEIDGKPLNHLDYIVALQDLAYKVIPSGEEDGKDTDRVYISVLA